MSLSQADVCRTPSGTHHWTGDFLPTVSPRTLMSSSQQILKVIEGMVSRNQEW